MPDAPTACTHLKPAARSPRAIERALAAAEHRCRAAGERWTEPRRRTYELLVRKAGPRKAYDLIAGFKPAPPTKPPTVYRALEFLIGLGLVHRIESLNAYVACSASEPTHAPEFLICDCCGRIEELAANPLTAPGLGAAAGGFDIHRWVLEVHGTCAACRL